VWSPEELVALVTHRAPKFPAGTEFSYSNTNFIILAILIEEITAQPFAEVMRARVIDPAAMPNTYLAGAEDGPEPFGAYSRNSDELAPIDFDYTSIETSAWSAGAMVSTAEDAHVLFTAVYAGQIISADMLEEMTSNDEYGFGIETWDAEKSAVGHGGTIPGYNTLVFHSPATGTTAFWVSSSEALNFGPSVVDVVEALINEGPTPGLTKPATFRPQRTIERMRQYSALAARLCRAFLETEG
jgi:D-alanyl-D-alanine carboxypeptidase